MISRGDIDQEGDETFNVSLTGAPAQVTTSAGIVTITDDETGNVRIKSGSTSLVGTEGGDVTVILERIGGSSGPIDVDYTLANVDTKNADYADDPTWNGTVSWTGDDAADKSITISLTNDDWLEGDENFTLTLTDSPVVLSPKVSSIKINKNDDIEFAVGSASKVEGDAGTSDVILTVVRTGGVVEAGGASIDLGCSTSPGPATAATPDVDYVSTCSGFSFGPGDPNPTLTLTVKGDTDEEGDENFTVELTNEPSQVTATSGVVTITDDESGTVRIKSGSTDLSGDEGGNAEITLERIGGSAGALDVGYTLANIDTKAADYADDPTWNGTVSWAAGNSDHKKITISLTDDTWLEGDENFTLTLTDASHVVSPKVSAIKINKNDDINFAVQTTASSAEGDDPTTTNVALTVTRSGGTIEAGAPSINLTCSTSPGPAPFADQSNDYNPVCADVSFASGDNSKDITVVINGDDYDEEDEKFTVSLSESLDQVAISPDSGVVTILNDDTEDPGVISVTQISPINPVPEGVGVVTVTLQRAPGDHTDPAEVYYSTQAVTATNCTVPPAVSCAEGDNDFTEIPDDTNKMLWASNPGNQPAETKTFDITIIDDSAAEETIEEFLVKIKPVDIATTGIGTGQATVQIAPSDNPGKVSIANGYTSLSGDEGGSVIVRLERIGGSTGAIDIGYVLADGETKSSDYVDDPVHAGTVSWPAGETTHKDVTIGIADDNWLEGDETFTLTLTTGETDDPKVSTIKINKNDDIDFAVGSASQDEQDEPTTTDVILPVVRTGGEVEPGGAPIVLACSTSPGPAPAATSGVDYATACAGGISFGPGDPDPTVTVTVNGDSDNEGDENFTVSLTGAPAQVTTSSGVVTIADDEAGFARVKIGSLNVSGDEGGDATVTLERSGGSTGVLNATYTLGHVSTKPADYTDDPVYNGSVSWADGDGADKVVTLSLTDDAWLEGDEVFTLTLADSPSVTSPKVANVTINKNDDITFAVGSVANDEGDSGTTDVDITVTRTGGVIEAGEPDITLGCTTSPGPAPAADATDYVEACTGFDFGAGDTDPTVTVTLKGDMETELDEKFTVYLTGAPAQVETTPGVVTITNDDIADISITDVSPANPVSEGDGVVMVTLSRDNDLSGEVSVYYYTTPGSVPGSSATNCEAPAACNDGDNDFTAIAEDSVMHTWADGEGDDFVFPITLIDDTAAENLESFTVHIKPADLDTIVGISTATIEIAGNDQAGTIAIDPDSYLVNEEDGTVTITVKRTPLGATGSATVVYWTEDGGAESCDTLPPGCNPATDGDFENIPESAGNTLVFPTGGSMTFDVNIHPDAITEGPETFFVRIKETDGVSGATVDTDPATVTIAGNGGQISTAGVISVAPSFYSRNEAQGSVTVQLNRTGGTSGAVGVTAFTTNGTAVAPGDFDIIVGQTVEWASGDATPKFVTVTGFDDGVPITDPNEAASELFTVSIKDPTGGVSISSTAHTADVEIRDEISVSEGTVTIIPTDAVAEGDGTIGVKVARVGGSTGVVQVDYVTVANEATGANGGAADDDYLYTSGTLVWADGDSSDKFVTVTIVDDADIEGPEIFHVELSNPKGQDDVGTPVDEGAPAIGNSSSDITISDNDGAGDFSIDDVLILEELAPTKAVLTITRTNDGDLGVTLTVKTFDGSASAGSDYAATSTNVVWAEGDTADQKQVMVDIFENDDTGERMIENFYVVITSFVGTGAVINDGVGEVTIVKNFPPIPTLNQWALMLLALLAALIGISRIRKMSLSRG